MNYNENPKENHFLEHPEFGKQRASNELRNRGVVSPEGVRGIWLRNNIETYTKRLKSLSDKVSSDNMILSDSQVVALERAKSAKASHGAIETFYPGYLVAQDTCYIGYLKGVGFVYLQTAIDTYAFAKLYVHKNAVVAADLLRDKVVSFFEENGLRVQWQNTNKNIFRWY